jgi:hypothetical protein
MQKEVVAWCRSQLGRLDDTELAYAEENNCAGDQGRGSTDTCEFNRLKQRRSSGTRLPLLGDANEDEAGNQARC